MDSAKRKLAKLQAMEDAPVIETLKELERVDFAIDETNKKITEVQDGAMQIVEAINNLDQTKADKEDVANQIENIARIPGRPGNQGPKGDRGDRGEKGEKGDTTVVDRVIERTEVIKEIPIVTENIVEKITEDIAGETIVDRINQNTKQIKKERIEGLDDIERIAKANASNYKAYTGITETRVKELINQSDASNDTLQGVTDRGATTDNIISVPGVTHQTTYTPTGSEPIGTTFWDSVEGTISTKLSSEVSLQHGRELHFYGKAVGNIANGDLCQYAGVQGDHILIKKAVAAEIVANPFILVGVATETFTNGNFGRTTWFGRINGVYTKTPSNNDDANWVAGDQLYLSNTTGQLTKTEPVAPEKRINIGFVIKTQTGSAENGIIEIAPEYGTRMQDLDDVNGTALTVDGQIPTWHNTEKYFDFDKNINDYLLSTTASSTYAKLDGTNQPFQPTVDSTTRYKFNDKDGNVIVNVDTTNNRLGILNNTPTANLHVGSAHTSVSLTNTIAKFVDNLDGLSGIDMSNTSTGINAEYRFIIADTSDHIFTMTQPGAGNTNTLFGVTRSTADYIFNNGGTLRDMIIGTVGAKSVSIGTTNVKRFNIQSDGEIRIPADYATGAAGALSFGAGQDMEMGYNGTAGRIDTSLVAASDLVIDCGTDKTLVLDETVWDDLAPSPIIAAKLGATAPTLATFVTDVEQYTFDATNDYVIGATEITHKWKEGTTIYPHIHWANNGTNATDRGVKWQLKYTVGDAMETFSAQTTTVVDVTIPLATADRTHMINDFATPIDGTNLKIGAYICWRLERIATAHANGAPANDPFALALGFHVEMDTIGSRTKTAK